MFESSKISFEECKRKNEIENLKAIFFEKVEFF